MPPEFEIKNYTTRRSSRSRSPSCDQDRRRSASPGNSHLRSGDDDEANDEEDEDDDGVEAVSVYNLNKCLCLSTADLLANCVKVTAVIYEVCGTAWYLVYWMLGAILQGEVDEAADELADILDGEVDFKEPRAGCGRKRTKGKGSTTGRQSKKNKGVDDCHASGTLAAFCVTHMTIFTETVYEYVLMC